ncbi:MAG: hypothetical protein ABJB85_09450 [Nitrososphaerota archaeon]
MEGQKSLGKYKFLESITSNRRVAIASGIVLTVIVIFGLLMTRQILFFDANAETLFFIITVVVGYGVVSWILLGYTKRITTELRFKSKFINRIQIAIKVIQFSLFGILLIAVFSQLIYGPYNSNSRYFAISVFAISSVVSGIILGLLAYKFFRWYRLTDKRNVVVLFYGLAAAALAISITADAANKLLVLDVIQQKSLPNAVPHAYFSYKYSETLHGRVQYVFVNPQVNTTLILPKESEGLYQAVNYLESYPPYILSWIATVLLLYNFYQRVGRFPVRYWIILSIPLILYLIGSGYVFSLPKDTTYLYYFRLLFRGGTIASSVLFGLIFYIITKNVNARKLKDYLIITAIGIISVGIANETSANQVTYGAAVHSLVLLSSFMFTLGLYSAALSISQDTSMRRTIKKSIPELFDNIGAAQLEQVLKERVMKLVHANQEKMEEETGGVSYTLTEDELKDYMQQVIHEKQSKR